MTWQTFVDPAFSSRLCLMLLHSLWQVAAVALVVWGLDRLWPKRSVERSYTLHVAALLAALVAMPVTYRVLGSGAERVGASVPKAAMPASAAVVEPVLSVEPDATVDAEPLGAKIGAPSVSPSTTELPAPAITSSFWQQAAPWVLIGYVVGVVLMLVRLVRAMMSTNRLSIGAKKIVDGPLVDALRSLARKWSLRVVPVLAETQEIVVPKVIGLARPMILLPAAAIAGLSMGELEMILAHELAHVRRHDMWVNLVQRLAEAILFFNPPLWYLSRRISTLREYCCDEMTCQAILDTDTEPKLRYATALLRVVELAQPNAASDLAAMAASGRSPSELRRRVARLFGEPLREPVRVTRTGFLMIVGIALLVVAGPSIWSTEAQTSESEKKKSAETKEFLFGGKIEVLAIGTHGEETHQWWDADGEPLESVPFKIQGGSVSGEVQRELVFRIHDLPEGSNVTWKLSSTGASANGEVVLDGIESPPGYYSEVFSTQEEVDAFDLRVGVASGKWVTVTDGDAHGSSSIGLLGGKGVVWSGAFAKDDGVVTVVSHNFTDSDIRVVAIDQQGNQHKAGRWGSTATGTVNQSKWTFQNLKPDEVKRFEFQVRPYEWVEIKGLPVQPLKEEKTADTPATISGRIVLEDGSPATVKGWLYSNSSYGTGPDTSVINHINQSTEGRFTDTFSCEVHSGTVWLKYFPESYAPAWVGPLELKPGQRLDDVTITLKPGFSELVKVSNEQGEPVVGATLVAHPVINGNTSGPNFEKTTDENGEYLLTHLADTRYSLRITAPGYQPLRTAPLRLEPGEVLRPTMIRSKPGTGVVRFADGTPAPGTKLYCKREISEDGHNNGYSDDYGKLLTTCDATGRFSLDQLADGSRYLFVVEAVDGARGFVTDLGAGQKDVQIVLPRRHDLFVKITGDLSKFPKRHGKPFVSVRQRIRDVGYSEPIGGDVPIELTEEGGTAIFRGLAIDLSENAGTQQVEVSLGNDPMATKTVEINRSGGTVVEFVLPEAISDHVKPREKLARNNGLVQQLEQQCSFVTKTYGRRGGNQYLKSLQLSNASESALKTLGKVQGLEELSIVTTDLRVPAFESVSNLTSLKRLTTTNCQLLPTQLEVIKNLTELEHLDLTFSVFQETKESRTQLLGDLSSEELLMRDALKLRGKKVHIIQAALLTDRAMPFLSKLTKLRTLRLVNTFFTSVGLEHLKPLVELESLNIGVVDFSEKSAMLLQRMPKLRSLRYLNANDKIVAQLSKIGSLEELDIWSGEVTDVGATQLANMTKMRRLEIRGNQMTDKGLEEIRRLPLLTHLDLTYAEEITPQGIARFRQLRPSVKIKTDIKQMTSATISGRIVLEDGSPATKEADGDVRWVVDKNRGKGVAEEASLETKRLSVLRELVGHHQSIHDRLRVLYKAGKPGGESEKVFLAYFHLLTARAVLAQTLGRHGEAVKLYEQAVKAADTNIEVHRTSYNSGRVTAASVLEAGKLRAEAKLALSEARAAQRKAKHETVETLSMRHKFP